MDINLTQTILAKDILFCKIGYNGFKAIDPTTSRATPNTHYTGISQ